VSVLPRPIDQDVLRNVFAKTLDEKK